MIFENTYGPIAVIYSFFPLREIYENDLNVISKSIYEMMNRDIHLWKDCCFENYNDFEKQKCHCRISYIKNTIYNPFLLEKISSLLIYTKSKISLELVQSIYEQSKDKKYIVRILFEKLVDDSAGLNQAMLFIYNTKEFDPSLYKNYAILHASRNGNLEIVKHLLTDDRVDPSDNNDISITRAAEACHFDVVKLLMKDHRVNPSIGGEFDINNTVLRYAYSEGRLDIVELVLRDDRSYGIEEWFECILQEKDKDLFKNLKLLELILERCDDNVNLSRNKNFLLRYAIKYKHSKIVELLLDNDKVRKKIGLD